MKLENLFAALPASQDREHILPVLEDSGIRIERIISNGHPSPPDFWYDQESAEWVALLCGSATLKFADDREVALKAGDWLLIERHARHRVEAVSQDAVWLAVYYDETAPRGNGG
ncbi:MAG TPA: cupin domain-containing protein [Chthoniobacteraceae bacterium]|jgi:cupin 2 domain-containing protein|nr:cupin domain-containing protein [Chthoniobacteraceae bacterium]